jgi:hypothetical protein
MKTKTLLKVLSEQFGFITKDDLDVIKSEMPNLKVLIRCGAERYVEFACHAEKRMELVAQKGDYVRDVSLPCGMLDEMLKDSTTDPLVIQAIKAMRV